MEAGLGNYGVPSAGGGGERVLIAGGRVVAGVGGGGQRCFGVSRFSDGVGDRQPPPKPSMVWVWFFFGGGKWDESSEGRLWGGRWEVVQRWLGPSGKVLFGDEEERSGDEFVVRGDEKPLVRLRESWTNSSSLWLLAGADCSLRLGFCSESSSI